MAVPQVPPKTVGDVPARQSVNGRASGQLSPAITPTVARSGAVGVKAQTALEDTVSRTPKIAAAPDLSNAVSKLHIEPNLPTQDNSPDSSEADQLKASSLSGDEHSHISGSSSKLQSFDTKSIASVTTFQMDEKESLRPDDSASVQAVEDNESSVNSRVGSELGPGNSKEQPKERFSKRGPVILPSGAPRFGDAAVVTPGNLPQNPALRQMSFISGERIQTPDAPPLLSPDEKLLEAMSTPKDRLLLLQLEEKILTFIHQSKYIPSESSLIKKLITFTETNTLNCRRKIRLVECWHINWPIIIILIISFLTISALFAFSEQRHRACKLGSSLSFGDY